MKKAAFVLSVILAASLSVSCGNSNETTDSATVSETVTEAVSANVNEPDLSAISVFELASDDLHDGVWDSDITNTFNGSDRSPQLSWKPVDGASDYVIYMIDTGAGNRVHLKLDAPLIQLVIIIMN
ncbi:MAG: hypothetical protein KBA55_10325 [Ruminococcus sp.]|nr:hypothetical protein [Ruminococcus sp.]